MIVGLTSVGVLAKTSAPVPVSSVTAVAKFALDGVAKNVATPDPSPEIPVETGNPVALVSVPLDGVPRAPPLTTKAPADPVLTPRAVTTPVPVVTVAGAAPTPPPTTRAFAASAALEAHVLPFEKYGTPPDVPEIVNAGVVVGLAIETMPPVQLTLVTVPVPLPAGVAQVPSPRQKVLADAPVPLPRFVTGKLPVTWVAKLTPVNAPPSVILPALVTVPLREMPLTVPVPPTEVTVPAAAAGTAQVPSPRQKLVEVAPVPLFRLVTGRLPVTPVESGRPVALVSVTLTGVPSVGLDMTGLVRVTPASVAAVAPSATLVEPIVTEEFVRPALGMVVEAVTALAPLAYI